MEKRTEEAKREEGAEQTIDYGRPYYFGKTAKEYGRYRDIYPPAFYDAVLRLGLVRKGQQVLDLGTGTGVFPRAMAFTGASFTAADLSSRQIEEAKRLSHQAGESIRYLVGAAEELDFEEDSFHTATACQCFWYFDKARLMPRLKRWLRPGGLLGLLSMGWLPAESEIAHDSEQLVLRHNPYWTGHSWQRAEARLPDWAEAYGFSMHRAEAFKIDLPFTREGWNGRMTTCRGVGASLSPEETAAFSAQHLRLLAGIAPQQFTIPHWVVLIALKNDK